MFFVVMLGSILLNYLWGLAVNKWRNAKGIKWILAGAVGCNLLVLYLFKYLAFSVEIVNGILRTALPVPEILLPIGISFFTFQAISYVLDVYYERGEVQKNLLNVGLYISFFPQLVAGPIVRYNTIAKEINHRKENTEDFAMGVERFFIGFCKKILLANQFAQIADIPFAVSTQGMVMGADLAWIGAIAYSLQIFFDFSGYSDMAIGLGRMFGFHFNENFHFPYFANSVSDFWRRWHISLGSWFRDYVYIPLGGSRVSTKRLVWNLFAVWFLTGIWHGANWTFLVWGLFYFVLITFEKLTGLPEKINPLWGRILYRMMVLTAVIGGWVVFRSESMGDAYRYVKVMFGLGDLGIRDSRAVFCLREYWVFWLVGVYLCFPIGGLIKNKISKFLWIQKVFEIIRPFLVTFLFCVAVTYLIVSDYNPFIYFNF